MSDKFEPGRLHHIGRLIVVEPAGTCDCPQPRRVAANKRRPRGLVPGLGCPDEVPIARLTHDLRRYSATYCSWSCCGLRQDRRQFDAKTQHFAGIAAFTQSVGVVENELLEPESMPEPFRTSLVTNLATLDRYRPLTYGQQVSRAVAAMREPTVATAAHAEWETERPSELHLDGVVVSGRADAILDDEDGVPTALAILDYKTSTKAGNDHALQLQVYANAGPRRSRRARGLCPRPEGGHAHRCRRDRRRRRGIGTSRQRGRRQLARPRLHPVTE